MKLKRIIVLLVLFSYININAKMNMTYGEAVNSAEDYINQNDKFDDKAFVSSHIGLLNKNEYEIVGGTNSYLFDGGNYWTMTDEGNRAYAVKNNSLQLDDKMNSNGIRVTMFISDVGIDISGSGTYVNSWKLSPHFETPKVSFISVDPSEEVYSKNRNITVEISGGSLKLIENQELLYQFRLNNGTKSCDVGGSGVSGYNSAILQYQSDNEATASISVPSGLNGTYYLCLAPSVVNEKGLYNNSNDLIAKDFNFDSTTPTVIASTSVENKNNGKITATVTDATPSSGIKKYYYGYSNSGTTCDPTTSQTINTWTKAFTTSGRYNMCVKVEDNAGNMSSVVTKTVLIDNNAPEVSVNMSRDVCNKRITVNVTATDEHSGILEYKYGLKRGSNCDFQNTSSSFSAQTYSGLTYGSDYTFCVQVKDKYGNVTEKISRTNLRTPLNNECDGSGGNTGGDSGNPTGPGICVTPPCPNDPPTETPLG